MTLARQLDIRELVTTRNNNNAVIVIVTIMAMIMAA